MTSRHARIEADMILRMSRCHASGAMWATLSALLLHADATGQCFPSLSTIAAIAGLERRTLTRALNALDDAGVIDRERHGRTPTRYSVALGACTSLALGTPTPLGVGASEVAARDESVPELGAPTPPELKTLNTDNKKVLTGAPSSDRLPAGSDDEPAEEEQARRRAANAARRQQLREVGIRV